MINTKYAIDTGITTKADREKFKEADKAYEKALANLKAVFPMEEATYMTETHIINTKIRKGKNSEYLVFDVTEIEE